MRRVRRETSASNSRMFATSVQSVPPKMPVYSYHCTAQTSCEKPLPSSSHGHENSPTVYQYSVAIHALTSTV